MTLTPETRILWCDIETPGLNVGLDQPLEISFAITDLDFKMKDSVTVTIWDIWASHRFESLKADAVRGDQNAKYVLAMHTDNGLFEEARTTGVSLATARDVLNEFISRHDLGRNDPVAGSSVSFDRKVLDVWAHDVNERLGYRIIDVSSLKETARRFAPQVFESVDLSCKSRKAGLNAKSHRSLADIYSSIYEYQSYLDAFGIQKIPDDLF